MSIDYSRNYFPQLEETKPVPGRPLQQYIWYPARKSSRQFMRYVTYFNLAAKELNQADSLQQKEDLIREFRNGPLSPYFPNGLTDNEWKTIENTFTACLHNARPVSGKFPVVLHIGGATTNSILLEYLASYGYIVVSIPLMGSSPAFFGRGEENLSLLFYQADDIEFTINQVSKLPEADMNNIAMIGMFAQTGLYVQSKSMMFDAVALLESFLAPELTQLPYFKPSSIRIPVLEIMNSTRDKNPSMLDTMQYATRYRVKFKNMPHSEFYPFSKIANLTDTITQQRYDRVAFYTLQFLNATLKKIRKLNR